MHTTARIVSGRASNIERADPPEPRCYPEYGVYELAADEDRVCVGIAAGTLEFAAQSISVWSDYLDPLRDSMSGDMIFLNRD